MGRLQSITSRVTTADLRRAKPVPKKAEPFYLSAEWRALAKAVVAERGHRCEDCGRQGCRLFVDHVVELRDGGDPLARRNLRVRCGSCHGKKTAAERARRMAADPGPRS